MKKFALAILKALMKQKDPVSFAIMLISLLITIYICGWFHLTPLTAFNGAIRMFQDEEIIIKAEK